MKWLITLIALIVLITLYFLWMAWIMHNVKTPKYTVIEKSNSFEIRDYAPMIIATVHVSGDRSEAINQGFRKLAAFIFGDNHQANQSSTKIAMTAPVMQQSEKIAMTTPVMQSHAENSNHWKVQFVMPADYTLETLPKPNNQDIQITQQPAHKIVAITFSGRPTAEKLAKYQQHLTQFITDKHLKTIGEPIYAFYNPPWTLPMLRRNEILWQLA
jgi:effector-binding domain-containing protein